MNPGIPQKFVEFGTVYHLILKALHEHGPMGGGELTELLEITRNSVGMALFRLKCHGFVFVVDKRSELDTDQRTHEVFSLKRPKTKFVPPPISTPTQRQAKYRAKKRLKVASVFQFRGEIQIAQRDQG